MRIGVIGCGVMGQNHLKVFQRLNNNIELVGICDIKENLVNELAKKYNTKPFVNYKDLLEQNLEIVDIAVPTTIHKEVALEALDTDAHAFIEKPICESVEGALEILKKAKQKNRKIMVGHIERFNPAIKKLKEIIDKGILGEIVSISSKRVGPYTPRTYDVGVILDLGTHDIDIISYLYGERVKEVFAVAGQVIHPFEDHASIMLKLDNGHAGFIETNWLTPHKIRKLSVIGKEAVAEMDFLTQKIIIHDEKKSWEAKVKYSEPLFNELSHFIEIVENGKTPFVTGEDATHALEVALSAIKSYKERKTIKINNSYE